MAPLEQIVSRTLVREEARRATLGSDLSSLSWGGGCQLSGRSREAEARTLAQLEDLKHGASVRGILPDRPVTVIDVRWFGDTAVEVTYRDEETGRPESRLLYRADEDRWPSSKAASDGHTTVTAICSGSSRKRSASGSRICLTHIWL